MSVATGSCPHHPEVIAGFRCDAECRTRLCGACTARSMNQHFCCKCGGAASQLTIARSAQPASHWVTGALAYPLRAGLPLFAGAAILLALVAFAARAIPSDPGDLAVPSAIIRALLVAVYLVLVVDGTARGNERESGLAIRIARALVACAPVWVPALVYVIFVGTPRSGDPLWYLFAGLAAVYLPLALAVAVTDLGFADAAKPFSIFTIAWPLGIARQLRLIALVALLGGIALALARAKVAITTPVLGELVAIAPALAVLTLLAHAIGLAPHIHGDVLRWTTAEALVDPLYPRQRATGQRKLTEVLTTESLTKNSGGSGGSAAERTAAQKIVELLKADQAARALAAYAARESWTPGTFTERQFLTLGKAALRTKQPDVALALYDTAIEHVAKPTGHAMFAKAQLLAERGDAAAATKLYEDLVAKYRDGDVVKLAKKALGQG